MNKFISMLLAIGLASTLTACKGGSKSGSSEFGHLTTYSQEEVVADMVQLNKSEDKLESLGFKFEKSSDSKNGVETTTMSWNRKAFDNSTATISESLEAFQEFHRLASAHLNKYSAPFNLKNSDGSLEARKLTDSAKLELSLKIELAAKAIAKLKE